MPVKNFKRYQTLSNICNNTFNNKMLKSNTESVIMKLTDDETMDIKFICVVNFGDTNEMKQMMPRFKKEALSVIDAALNSVKENYNKEANDKVSLKLDMDTVQEAVEWISYQLYNPKKTAYYKLFCTATVK